MPKPKDTSWTKGAKWYKETIEKPDSYQNTVILPNLLRLMEIKKEQTVLDLGCGTGFFSREFAKLGAKVVGVDLGPDLIAEAKKNSNNIEYYVADAADINFLPDNNFDKVAIVLALQNMADLGKVIAECSRVIRDQGKMFLVLNHPAFRVPQASEWGWDEAKRVQYRRMDKYLSEERVKIEMHPGEKNGEFTYSFHRPLQVYFKAFAKHGFSVTKLEEWTSPKITPHGPRAGAENASRKEFPLFLFLELQKI